MKNILKILTLLFLLNLSLYAFSTKISSAHAIAIFDKQGNGENIQHLRISKHDYNGLCYSKIVVIGKLNKTMPTVNIGSSKGHFQKSISIYNRDKIKIGEELTYKHENVTKGYFEVRILGKLFDTKVFIK
jgi:hypothetical protein